MELLTLLGTLIGAASLTWFTNWIGLRGWRRTTELHWTDRARLLHPLRMAAMLNVLVMLFLFPLAQQVFLPTPRLPWFSTIPFAFVGAMLGTFPFERETLPNVVFRDWLTFVAASLCLQLASWIVIIGAMIIMPLDFGWKTWTIGFVVVTFQLSLHLGLGIHLAHVFRILQPPNDRLRLIVSEVSERIQRPVRAVWILRAPYSNAAALPATGDLVFSDRLLESLSDDEVAAVCAHELGHLSESRFTVVQRIIGAMAYVPWIFIKPLIRTFLAGGFFLLAIPFILKFFVLRMARRMEVRADTLACQSEEEAKIYARALERMHETNRLPAVMPGRGTHPHLYDRMLDAGVTPSYPRPKPPRRLSYHGLLMLVLLGFFFMLFIIQR